MLSNTSSYGYDRSYPVGVSEIFNTPYGQFGSNGVSTEAIKTAYAYQPQNVDLQNMGGWTPDKSSLVSKDRSNTEIHHTYGLVTFEDKSETRIMENMLVFVAKHFDPQTQDCGIVTIGKLNNILRDAHSIFNEWLQAGIEEAQNFKRYLVEIGEDKLEYYDRLRRTCEYDEIRAFEQDVPGISDFHDLATNDVYYCQTQFGFLSRWNFLGVVKTKMQAISLQSVSMVHATSETFVIGVVTGEKARVYNYWGGFKDTRTGAKVYLILKRRKTRKSLDGPDEAFQIYTYATTLRETVPKNALKYTNPSEKVRYGHTWKVGTVSQRSDMEPHDGKREKALGLSGNEKQSYEACPTLPTMYIQLGI